MDRDQIERSDFPPAPDGYDRASVDAHLAAVAATVEALEARVHALGVEIEAVRRGAAPPAPTIEEPASESAHEVEAVSAELPADPVSARLLASKLCLDGLGRDEIVAKVSAAFRLDDPV